MSQKSLFSRMFQEFIPYINYAAASFPERHREDLRQEGCLGLYYACGAYDNTRGIPFDAFAKICIKHRMITAYKSMGRDDGTLELDEALTDGSEPSEIEGLEAKDFFERLRRELTELECRVLDEYLKDLSYEQISKNLDISLKQVDNTISRVKRKIRDKYTF